METVPQAMANTCFEFGQLCAYLRWYGEAIRKWVKTLSHERWHEDAMRELAFMSLQLEHTRSSGAALRCWREALKYLKKLLRSIPWEADAYKSHIKEC